MKLYLSCKTAFALKADGVFFGNFYDAALDFFEPRFIECIPHSGDDAVCFFADNRLKTRKNAAVYEIEDGLFVKLLPSKKTTDTFQAHMQKMLDGVLVTVYSLCGTRIVCENRGSAEVVDVPPGFGDFCAVQSNDYTAVYSSGSPCFIAIFHTGEKIRLQYANVVDEFEFTPIFRTKTRLYDLERTTVCCEWKSFNRPSVVESTSEFSLPPCAEKPLLRRVFFERILHGLCVESLLCEGLKSRAGMLRDYLGNFIGLLPEYCSKKGICLCYDGADRCLTKAFDIELDNGLITNLCEV